MKVGACRLLYFTHRPEATRPSSSHRVASKQLPFEHASRWPCEVKKRKGDVPYRVFVRGTPLPGLAMSRALGDLCHSQVRLDREGV